MIYADSEDLNGSSVGIYRQQNAPFLMNGGIGLSLHSDPGIIRRLLTYEIFAMKLKKTYTDHVDWYLYNLSVSRKAHGKGIGSKLM